MPRIMLMLAAVGLQLAAAADVRPVATIPFTEHANGVYIKVQVNRSRPLQFLFDSAAGVHVVNWNRAVELDLAMDESPGNRATGAGDGSSRAAQLRNVQLRLGAFLLPEARTAAFDMDPIIQRKGFLLDGLIGADLLKHYVVEMDIGSGLMRVYDPSVWKYSGPGERIALRVDAAGMPYIRAAIVAEPGANPVEGEFLIDSAAAEATMVLTPAFAAKHHLAESVRRSGQRLISDEMFGAGGSSQAWTTRVEKVHLGRRFFARPVLDISGAKGGTFARAELAGIIGGEFLHRFRVIYDCPHSALYLEPTPRLQAPFEREMAGVRWFTSGDKLNQFRVRSVIPDSPAGRAGIREGDLLVSVDGKPASSFDKHSLEEHLQQNGRDVNLTFTRNGRPIAFAITLERLV